MAETYQEGSGAGADFDLSQFYQIFFEEAGENLDQMEQMLLDLDLSNADDEELNGIFRCAHSIKGGSATFGFSDVAELTHQMESLLDRLRRHELQPIPQMVDVLLESADASRSLLARHQAGGQGEAVSTTLLVRRISELAAGQVPRDVPAVAAPATPAPVPVAAAPVPPKLVVPGAPEQARQLEIQIGPLDRPDQADAIKELFRDIPGLGAIRDLTSAQPNTRLFGVETTSTNDDLLDLFAFHVSKDQVLIREAGAVDTPHAAHLDEDATLVLDGTGADAPYGFFDEAPGAPPSSASVVASQSAVHAPKVIAPKAAEPKAAIQAQMESTTIRVDVKKVELVTLGEATELDKGLVEKITDPLTHLVRNSCDHGVEMPAERLAKGKPEHGTITLSASHQGGSIVIEVRDDGKGLSREKILSKALERGLDVSEQMSDAEVWQLIFAPGFSTADEVTDVSGRGVGMDVVKRNIAALNGSVEIDSAEGYGMKVSVRLPLTLAIMDGMSVSVGEEVYILPLSSVVESFQVNGEDVSTVAQGSKLVKVREEYMPVIALEKIFQVPRVDLNKSSNIMVVVEADGSRVALLVDELLGQHQVVVKNLESNYRKVPNVSGATILGDGTVALILDTGGLVRRARH